MSKQDAPSDLTVGDVNRAYALISAAMACLKDRRTAHPDAAATAGSDIAIELMSITEDVLMGNPGGTHHGAGFESGTK